MKLVATLFALISFSLANGQINNKAISDTLNKLDDKNLKQGYWIHFEASNNSKKISEGRYINDLKEGIWLSFYPTGKIKTSITYQANKQNGYAKIFYENGKISEEGQWKINKWVGEYKFYYENGNPSYAWSFDDEGKRNGKQKYFYANGKVRIEGDWQGGKENGVIKEFYEDGKLKSEADWSGGKENGSVKEYYPNGQIKSEKKYANGVLDEKESRDYPEKNKIVEENKLNPNDQNQIEQIPDTNKQVNNIGVFDGNGFHKLFTKDKKIDREGLFQNGKLIDGKKYIYDENGTLVKIAVYENGRLKETIKP